ncbi:MAG: isopentenyl-diphosphate Delta-isomerase [Gammaproteobacteria bacterium]|nr:isopentenyl-diphosphate Delta-isomerase [Gammaproteobacteria bacterium]
MVHVCSLAGGARVTEAGGARARLWAGSDSSDEAESLILVDEADREVGYLSKARCHEGRGILHRAFSLLIFNERGELLLQRRSAAKRLWPHYWSNSCCSHPRRAETMEAAIHRRLYEELGLACPLQFLFKFQYQAQFDSAGAEHELCSVFIGRSSGQVAVDQEEISDWRWVSPERLAEEMGGERAEHFTPWFTMEWERIWRDHRPALHALQSRPGTRAEPGQHRS